MIKIRGGITILVLALALLAALLAPATEAAGAALVARVDEPFALNGQRYEAGTVTLKHHADYTPTSTLNQVWIDGECVGLLIADRIDGDADPGAMDFRRSARGGLVLVGFSYRGRSPRQLYAFRSSAEGAVRPVAASRPMDDPGEAVLAARLPVPAL